MKRYLLASCGLLLITILFVNADEPATGPSGTVCESAGGSCKGIPDGVMIPYQNYCGRFIVCFLECGCDKECSGGLHFNQKLQVCDWPAKANCDQSYVDPAPGPLEIQCGSSDGGSCKNITDGTLIANTNDCTVYTECSKGCEINRNCAGGTHFSQILKQCTWPSEAGCDSSYEHFNPGPPSPPTPPLVPTPCPCATGSTDKPSIPIVTLPSSKPTITSTPEPSGKPTPSFKPTPGSKPTPSSKPAPSTPAPNTPAPCTQCSTPSSQPPVPSREPSEVPFIRPTTPSSKPSSSSEPTPMPSSSRPSKPSPIPTLRPGQSSCSGQESGKLLPYDKSCLKYIACGDGIAYIMNCGSGLHFNAALEICDWPEQAGCDLSYVKPENTSCQSMGASCYGMEDGKLLPYAGNCERFVVCYNGCGFNMACGEGLHFNKYSEVCDWPEDAGCEVKIPSPSTTTKTTTNIDGLTNSGTRSTTSRTTSTQKPCQTCGESGSGTTSTTSSTTSTQKPCQTCGGSNTTTPPCYSCACSCT